MSNMQTVARDLLEETDPEARAAMGRQLATMVLRLLCPTDEYAADLLAELEGLTPAAETADDDELPF